MGYRFAFAPDLPPLLIAAIIALIAIPVGWALLRGVRGSLVRLVALCVLALALLNPSLLIEEREALKSVIAMVVDRSGSQKLDIREDQTEKAAAALAARIGQLEQFELRRIDASEQVTGDTDVSTALFEALRIGMKDVPQDRVAGAVMITDGQVHDLPAEGAEIGISAPVHALVTGRSDERDRRIGIVAAPRYGVVDETYSITYEVLQDGFAESDPVAVSIFVDGEPVTIEQVAPGESYEFVDTIRHGGPNIIELRAEVADGELTEANNRVFATINGIRENLRVLLISGEPHAGERTWRNLLKADPSVDLVHFTILRPPEKQDGTPINQLSLIAFPTRELFVEKIDEFDLIIFDRYSRRGVLPILYFDNIARYVEDGGALLIAAGPEFGRDGSIAQTPLEQVLPAIPNGRIDEGPFKPRVSELGARHPVTRGLDGDDPQDPRWSRWFRLVGVDGTDGEAVMEDGKGDPLLILERFGEGRVALLLSDHAWLWARGFEGGGPHLQLLRRIAHWLMKEPELEEERLLAESREGRIEITRQSLLDDAGQTEVTLTGPSGSAQDLTLKASGAGIFTASAEPGEIGLHQVRHGELTTLVHAGPPNPREFAEVMSTTGRLEPILAPTRGSTQRIASSGEEVPRVIPVRPGATAAGNGWIGFENTGASVLKGVDRISLFAGLLGLALLLFAVAAVWAREGR